MARTKNIVLVVDRARGSQPYVVAPWRRVYRQISATQMEGLPLWEAQLVTHLLETGEFTRSSQVVSLTCDENTTRVVILEAPLRNDVEVKPSSTSTTEGRKDAD